MSGRAAGRSAWGLWTLTALAAASTLLLASLNEPSSARNSAVVALVILSFSTVGALVASRRPENPIGWLFLAGASCWVLGELALEYAVYALVTADGSLPAGAWAGWFGGWARGAGWLIIALFLLLLFPTGRLPSPRWRPVLWGAVSFCLFFTAVIWLSPTSSDLRLTFVSNPMGLELPFVNLLLEALYLSLPLTLLVSGAAVVVRFRRSSGDERQQIKWFAYAVGVMVSLFVFWFSLALTGLVPPDALLWTVPLLGLPAGVGVAVLRYRLYDIDRIINRTLVYGLLTVVLALVYAGSVVALQRVFAVLTGGDSSLAVVASTLAIAALFNPSRRRVQSFVDRRFYRGKYDAERILADFSATLREGTDLVKLDEDLISTVRETVQPEHASLWLRPGAGSGGRP